MASHDPRIDAYIAKSAEFARPILEHLRAVVHAACPEVEETLKWSSPHFGYKGSMMCSMAAFNQHCSFGFWLYKDVVGTDVEGADGERGMGQFGKLTSVKDLPQRPKVTPKPPPQLPEDFAALLAQKRHASARKTYDGFSPSAKREYVEWITEAKTDVTRQKRLATTLEWLAEGKQRNWKYMKC